MSNTAAYRALSAAVSLLGIRGTGSVGRTRWRHRRGAGAATTPWPEVVQAQGWPKAPGDRMYGAHRLRRFILPRDAVDPGVHRPRASEKCHSGAH